jgi:hypothetical protein
MNKTELNQLDFFVLSMKFHSSSTGNFLITAVRTGQCKKMPLQNKHNAAIEFSTAEKRSAN